MSILWRCPASADFQCVGAISKYHQNYPDLDAAAYIIGISTKNWVRQRLLGVGVWCMGPIMSWFVFGFVMSDALFHDFFSVCAWLSWIYHCRWLEFHYGTLQSIPNEVKGKLLAFGPKESPKYCIVLQDYAVILTRLAGCWWQIDILYPIWPF